MRRRGAGRIQQAAEASEAITHAPLGLGGVLLEGVPGRSSALWIAKAGAVGLGQGPAVSHSQRVALGSEARERGWR